jgi:DNA primase
MKFPPSFLDAIRSRVNISAVVSRSVQWDRRKSLPARGDFWACCPFHSEKTASFHADDRKGRYHCFGCKASGDIFTFLVEKEGLSFPEAVERLAAEAGLQMPQITPEEAARERRRASLYEVMDHAVRFFADQLQSTVGAKARGYLADRGLPMAVSQEFGLGYAPAGRYELRTHLAGLGIELDQMVEAGLVVTGDEIAVPRDRFRDRLIFPIRDGRGRVIAFGGRALAADVQPKYLNSPDTPLFHKGEVLYNLDKARKFAADRSRIIAVEGYMDVIAMCRGGFPETVAPLGTALTAMQLALLWRIAPEPVLCFDGDKAGMAAAHRAVDLALPLLVPGQSLRIALLPEGQDPDDLLRAGGGQALAAAIEAAEPLSEVLWRRALDANDRLTPERKARFETELLAQCAGIADQSVRTHYLADMRRRLRELWYQAPSPDRRTGRRLRFPVQSEVSRELKTMVGAGSDAARQRREGTIILAMINHPELISSHLDTLCELELDVPELDSMRRQIIDIAALHEGLDGRRLRDHLSARGYGAAIVRIEAQASRLNSWFVLPDAALADAETGLSQMLALYRKTVTLERELKIAERVLAEDTTEGNLRRLNDIREELRSATGTEVAVEGFGAASGRSQRPVT